MASLKIMSAYALGDASVLCHPSLLLMNSFNKTGAVFPMLAMLPFSQLSTYVLVC